MRHAALLLAVMPFCGAALAATDKYGITAEEHAACDNDAVALCASTFPDQEELLVCMKEKRDRLSASCAPVFRAGLKRRHIPL